MLLVKTKLALSPRDGIGIFAAQPIAQGTPVWRFERGFDLEFTRAELDALPEAAREQVYHYAYLDAELQKYILCTDDARFYNHSENPNTGPDPKQPNEYLDVALRDIAAGEEINCNYRDFYSDPEQIRFLTSAK